MKIEAIINATATATMDLSSAEGHECEGGFTVGTEITVEGIARVHGPNIVNWDDTNMWEYTFLPYQPINLWESYMVRGKSIYQTWCMILELIQGSVSSQMKL